MRVFLLGVMVAVAALMPASTMADDQQIADFIKARLMQEKQQGNLFGFNVDMRVDQGTVWFKGFVSNRSQELLILRTAQLAGHLGVVQVVDDIDVNTQPSQVNPLQPQVPQQNTMAQQNAMARQNVMPRQNVMAQQTQMPQQRVARTQQPYTSTGNYQMQNRGMIQRQTVPQNSYPQPQMQRPVQRLPQTTTPPAPRRMQMPMSVNEPKRDLTTKAVGYQEPIAQPRMPAYNNNVVGSPIQGAPTTQPSFQQNLRNATPAQQVATPMRTAPAMTSGAPLPFARATAQGCDTGCDSGGGGYYGDGTGIVSDSANLPGYAWPAYAAHPNYGAVSYPKQYSASAWPYIGPFYPYPQVPLGWRKVSLEWDDGWWFLDFSDKN